MPAPPPLKPAPGLFHGCYDCVQRETEFVVRDHLLVHLLSGHMQVFVAGAQHHYQVGDTFLITRHQLLKATKHPAADAPFSSVSITLDQATLREQGAVSPGAGVQGSATKPIVRLPAHPLLAELARAVVAYQAGPAVPGWPLLKVREALLLLLHLRPDLEPVLFNFSEPGKIDLQRFMMQHYSFNVELRQFAYLTGRSLATFKRDFEKLFHTTPSRWLHQKRLEEAHYLLQVRQRRPSEVYLEVGYENLSHFTTVFKKQFGYSPSRVPGLTN